MPIVFDNSDEKYRSWLQQHPRGFVLNTRRCPDPDYLVLHRAACSSTSSYTAMARPGGFTERAYIKTCADDVGELRRWVHERFGVNASFSAACARCKPET